MSAFYSLYVLLIRVFSCSTLLKLFGVREARRIAFQHEAWRNASKAPAGSRTTWFHASSTGELEMLMPLIESFNQKGIPLGVSVFSDSAIPFLSKLPKGLLYQGLSPRDDHWSELFRHFEVQRIILAKYESWPGLWSAASVSGIRLVLINAQWRRSLKVIKWLLKIFAHPLPRLDFFAVDQKNADALAAAFPQAKVEISSDPRWLRAMARAGQASQHLRVQSYRALSEQKKLKRPFLMVGSAWLSDLEKLVPALQSADSGVFDGTLWVVPHSLEGKNIIKIENYLEQNFSEKYLVIKEMGFLLELYSLADRIFVGGGFEKGIHSTLEPAVYRVPIACGPKNATKFFETHELQEHRYLTVCKNSDAIADWLRVKLALNPLLIDEKRVSIERLVEVSAQLR